MKVPYKFRTIADVKRFNEMCGYHFFKPDTMRYFNSYVHPKVWGGHFFITSERHNVVDPQRWTVRCISNQGRIYTLQEFQAYDSREHAELAAKDYANKYKDMEIPDGFDPCLMEEFNQKDSPKYDHYRSNMLRNITGKEDDDDIALGTAVID